MTAAAAPSGGPHADADLELELDAGAGELAPPAGDRGEGGLDASRRAAELARQSLRDREDQRDRRLIRRIRQGDDRAFEELVRHYQDRVFGLTLRMLANRQEAEDVAQEVFLSVHRAIHGWRGEGRFYTWLYRVATNHCKNRIKYLKGRNFHRASPVEDTPEAHLQTGGPGVPLQSQVPGPEAVVEGDRLQRAIAAELAALDPEHRLLIVLRDVQGLPYQEILRITGLQEGTLKSRLHRARIALKERLAPYLR